MDQYYFKTPFASSGDKTAIPEATQPDGKVSFVQGFTFDYERDLTTDPLAKAIPRNQDNWLHYAITDALRQYQQVGIPEWITPTDNGGSPVAYARAVLVIKGSIVYQSLVAANTGTPGVDADKWVPIPLLDQIAAATAAKWATPRSISLTGDVTAAFASVDGSANVSAVATIAPNAVKTGMIADASVTGPKLENSGVVPGIAGSSISVPAISVDAKGRITAMTDTAIRGAGLSQSGVVQLASAAEVNAGTNATKAVTPASLGASKGLVKAWVRFDGATGTIISAYNVASVSRPSAGNYVVNFTTPMADADYAIMLSCSLRTDRPSTSAAIGAPASISAASFPITIKTQDGATTRTEDAPIVTAVVYG